jgi:hypothetical protein
MGALMARVWSGLVVEEANIHVHVSALRKALDEGTRGQSHVVTVPGRGYRFVGLQPVPAADKGNFDAPQGLPLPDRPSIVVLPFANLSGDPEQEYFADGIVEDIITALSRMRWLFVIARNSSFAYKGRRPVVLFQVCPRGAAAPPPYGGRASMRSSPRWTRCPVRRRSLALAHRR